MSELKSIYGKTELKKRYEQLKEEEQEFYSSQAKQRKQKNIGNFFTKLAVATLVTGSTMTIGAIKSEVLKNFYNSTVAPAVTSAYKNVKEVFTGKETLAPTHETIDDKIKGGK